MEVDRATLSCMVQGKKEEEMTFEECYGD